jgi:iron complex outermembrane receptor protein
MKKILGFFLLVSINLWAQEGDTLRTILLSEVMVRSNIQQEDSLQNFFRANKSATTEEILARLQSVYLIRRGSFGQEPMIRGMSSGQINLTIDGMKMFGACTDKMDPVSIYVEPQNLKSLDVTAGSGGSRLGSTVGGSVDMKLAEPQFLLTKISGKAGVGFQSAANAFNGFANINYSQGKSAYYTSLNYRKSNDYRAGGGEIIQHSQYNKINFYTVGKWQIGKDELQANLLVDDGWDIGFPSLPMDVGYAKARIVSASYHRFRPNNFFENVTSKVYYNTIKHSMDDSQRPEVVMHMDMPGTSSTAGLYLEGNLQKIKNHNVSFRSDFYYNHVLAEMTMYPTGEQPMYMQTWPSSGKAVAGIYVNDRINLSNKAKLLVNGRIDFVQNLLKKGFGKDQLTVFYPDVKNSNYVIKTFNLNYNQLIGESLIVEMKVGYGERAATLSELYGFYLFNRADGFDYVGNPNLKSEKNVSGEVTLNYYKNKFQLSATGFYNYFTDYIFSEIHSEFIPMTPGANGVKVYSNIPNATLAGGETSLFYNLTESLQLISAWKYTRGADFEKTPLPLMPPLQAITTLRFSKPKYSLQIENESNFKQDRISPYYGEDYTAGYSIMNFRSSYTFKMHENSLAINASVENIFDLKYHNHLDWGNISRPGRNITINIMFRF